MNRNRVSQSRALENQQRGTYSDKGEIFDFTQYDTAAILSTTTTHRLFTVGLGGGATPKTLDITNMQQGAQMPQGHKLRIKALKVLYAGDAALVTVDLQFLMDLMRQTTVEFIISGKDQIGTWKLTELIGMPMAISSVPTVAGNNLSVWSQGIFSGVYHLRKQITLAALTNFEVRMIHHTAPNAALDGNQITIGLNGIMTRSS